MRFSEFLLYQERGGFQKSIGQRGPWKTGDVDLFKDALLFRILFVRNFGRVCSQLWLSVRNSVEGPFNRNSRENPPLCWLEGGGGLRGTKMVNKHFVNKLAFPICP